MKMHIGILAKNLSNRIASLFGVRVVNRIWGPRGFAATFEGAKSRGFSPATIIDIGASNGCWSLECQKVYPDADYFLIRSSARK